MIKSKNIAILLLFISVLMFSASSFAQTPPPSQTAGGVSRRDKQIEEQKALEAQIEKEKPSKEEIAPEDIATPDTDPKVLVKTIIVEGAVLLSEREIRSITSPFEGKELSLKNIQKIADLITDEYRKIGYVTSRAYVPPQTIRDGVLIIRVVEGKLGTLEIKGNRYFSTSLLEKTIDIEPSGYFDYSALQRSLIYINEHEDRIAKAILVPGKEPGTTDIIIEVEDNFPFHAQYSFDNWGSRYIGRYRHALIFQHNNVTGHDDKIYVKAQVSDGSHLVLQQARYVYPVTRRLEVGGHLLFSKLKIGQEFADLDSRGDAEIYGLLSNYTLIEKDDLEMRLNLGFDSKTITNELLGVQLSRDQLSILKGGFDLDVDDKWGRTIFTAECDQGIPEFLGAMDTKDSEASRTGAGGKFTKWMFHLFRLQPTPFSTSLLLKNSFQYTNNVVPASEQFQIGGPTSVRGYPPGEYSGDSGFYSAIELSIPPYGLSRDVKVPLRKESLYDAFRFVLFWDIGMVHRNNPQAGERDDDTLRGAGFGGRLTIAEDLEIRVETGYPFGRTPSDSDHAHTWVEFHLKI